jgi:membrane protein implicated in regulation of membrane protease activity
MCDLGIQNFTHFLVKVVRPKIIFYIVDFCLLLFFISREFFFLKINVVKSVFYALKSVIFVYFVRRFSQKQLLTEKSKLVQNVTKFILKGDIYDVKNTLNLFLEIIKIIRPFISDYD